MKTRAELAQNEAEEKRQRETIALQTPITQDKRLLLFPTERFASAVLNVGKVGE